VTDTAHDSKKKTLRATLREQLRAVAPDEIRSRSAAACDKLTATEEFAASRALMIFLPLAYEVDATPIAVRAWQMGKMVTVPRVGYEQRHMIPIEIRSLSEAMNEDHYGVRTPAHGEPIPVDLVDLVVVPGLGFDTQGHRLGRGGGFYDRFLSQAAFGGATCGLALDEQIVESIPALGHDVMLDMLVTDQRVLRFATLHRSR
jgi:5-formyltetrahydrofolate cyclo-ligase